GGDIGGARAIPVGIKEAAYQADQRLVVVCARVHAVWPIVMASGTGSGATVWRLAGSRNKAARRMPAWLARLARVRNASRDRVAMDRRSSRLRNSQFRAAYQAAELFATRCPAGPSAMEPR